MKPIATIKISPELAEFLESLREIREKAQPLIEAHDRAARIYMENLIMAGLGLDDPATLSNLPEIEGGISISGHAAG